MARVCNHSLHSSPFSSLNHSYMDTTLPLADQNQGGYITPASGAAPQTSFDSQVRQPGVNARMHDWVVAAAVWGSLVGSYQPSHIFYAQGNFVYTAQQ